MTIDLLKYLPRYYLESRIMKALMDAMGEEVPDAIGYLWKVFFANTVPEEGLWLWLQEYDASTREEVFAKMRGGGSLNLEMLHALGVDAVETYKLCPEEGITLSGDDAYFADGYYVAPLISDIYVTPKEVEITRQLISMAGMAGFRYWLAVKCKSIVIKAAVQQQGSIALFPSFNFPSLDEYLSGEVVFTGSRATISFESKSLVVSRISWFSPVIGFVDDITWDSQKIFRQVSKTTEILSPLESDTYLDCLKPDNSNEAETWLVVGGEGVNELSRSDYALLKFDLSGMDLNKSPYKCELFLYVASTKHFNCHEFPFDIHIVTDPWAEDTVTPGDAPAWQEGCVARKYLSNQLEADSEGTWVSWDITAALKYWKANENHGIVIVHTGYEGEGYDAVAFASTDYYEGNTSEVGEFAPYLNITIGH
jgi:hypothetical protein